VIIIYIKKKSSEPNATQTQKKEKKRTNEINDTKLLFFEILNIEALGCEERERERMWVGSFQLSNFQFFISQKPIMGKWTWIERRKRHEDILNG